MTSPTTAPTSGLTRRALLRSAAIGTGALACSAGLSSVDTALSVAMAADGTAYTGDTLVVLSLRGGFDGLSAVPPLLDPGYVKARPSLAVPASVALPADRGFGLHPALKPLHPLWTAGRLAAVVAVGQPTGSRSHFAATEELERAAPGTSIRTGWLDRVLGARGLGTPLQAVAVGEATSALSGPAPEALVRSLDDFALEGDPALLARRAAANARMWPDPRGPVATTQRALTEAARVRSTVPVGTGYPDTPLGRALADVARLVKARAGLQVACIDYGDWDHHEDLGTVDRGRLRTRLGGLAQALAAFDADLGTLMSGVTVVTLSEFGRRVAENGSAGTDHGNANTVLLMGGGVVGGKVHGAWPGLAPDQLDDGDLAVRTDYRDVLGEVLRLRCGVSDLAPVFPGLTHRPVGVARPR